MSIDSNQIFITGISRGLGHGFARKYLMEGAKVYGCARGIPGDLLELFPENLTFRQLDLSDELNGVGGLKELLSGVQHLDIVILNAAVLGEIGDMRETGTAELKTIMEINLWSNKWILDTILTEVPSVRQVVAISSGASTSGSRGWNGYSLSKAALNMMIKLYAGEVHATHFCSLAPGLIDTAMQAYLTSLPVDERFSSLERLKQARGTDQMPNPDKAAESILSLFPNLMDHPSGSYLDVRKMV